MGTGTQVNILESGFFFFNVFSGSYDFVSINAKFVILIHTLVNVHH